jgi:hypothetical protein
MGDPKVEGFAEVIRSTASLKATVGCLGAPAAAGATAAAPDFFFWEPPTVFTVGGGGGAGVIAFIIGFCVAKYAPS